MIQILARQVIRKECLGQYYALAEELAQKSRQEPGCVSYASVQSQQDERVHVFVECWRDQAAIDAHNASEHFRRIVPQFAGMFDGPEQVELFRVVI